MYIVDVCNIQRLLMPFQYNLAINQVKVAGTLYITVFVILNCSLTTQGNKNMHIPYLAQEQCNKNAFKSSCFLLNCSRNIFEKYIIFENVMYP